MVFPACRNEAGVGLIVGPVETDLDGVVFRHELLDPDYLWFLFLTNKFKVASTNRTRTAGGDAFQSFSQRQLFHPILPTVPTTAP